MDRNPRVTFLMHRAMGCALLCAAAGPALCQSVPGMSPAVPGSTPASVAPGTPAGSYALSDLETIDLYSGKVNFIVPIRDIASRGSAGYRMTVPVQRGWTVGQVMVGATNELLALSTETPDTSFGALASEPDVALEPYVPGYMVFRSVAYSAATPVTCPDGGKVVASSNGHTLTKVVFLEPDGTETEFVDQAYGGAPQPLPGTSCQNEGTGVSRGTVFMAVDGSAKTFIASAPVVDETWVAPKMGVINGMLLFPDGTRYDVNSAGNPNLPFGHVTGIYDPKGNYTQILGDQPPCTIAPPCTPSDQPMFQVQEPTDRYTAVFLANVAASPVQDVIIYLGAGGALRDVWVNYSQMSSVLAAGQSIDDYSCLFFFARTTEAGNPFNPWVISSIVLPNSEQYSFLYNSYGDVVQITLPTGGSVQYTYNTLSQGSCDAGGSIPSGFNAANNTIQRPLQERKVLKDGVNVEQDTTYAYGIVSSTANGGAGETQVIVTHRNPSTLATISQEYHEFFGDVNADAPSDPTIYPFWQEGKEYETDFYNGSGALLRTVVNAWQQRQCGQFPADASCYGGPSGGNGYINASSYKPNGAELTSINSPQAPVHYTSLFTATTTLADASPNPVSQVKYGNYDQYNNPASVTEYDYGSGAVGAALRTTKTTYLTNGYDTLNSTVSSTVHIRRAPIDRIVYDGNNNYVAETQYSYDDSLPTAASGTPSGYVAPSWSQSCSPVPTGTCLGNLTTTKQWSSTFSSFLSTTKTYDTLGNVLSVTDPDTNKTSYSYADSFSTGTELVPGYSADAFPTTVTNALSQVTTYKYDYYLGRPTYATDPNSIQTEFAYGDGNNDKLDRLSQVQRGIVNGTATAQTTYTYNDTPNAVSVTTTSDQNALNDNAIESIVSYDGLARKSETEQQVPCGSGNGDIVVVQTYDNMGRPYTVTNPYRPCNSEAAENTTTLYDALNRPTSVTTADSSATSMTYAGNKTTLTDPASVTRSTLTDALGRITSVTEANTTTTSYAYDTLNDLTLVCQGAALVSGLCPSGTQSRAFGYDSLARLKSATNPEGGTTSYTYDYNGNLTYKTDSNLNDTTLAYDALNRITSKTYTYSSSYYTPTVDYCYDGNTQSPCNTAPSGATNYLVGRLTQVTSSASTTNYSKYSALGDILSSSQITGGNPYPFGYTYNLANAMKTMTQPSGRTFTWTYDIANRATKLAGAPSGGGTTNYASSIAYASQGPISQFTLGSGLVENRSYDPYRQQPTGVTLGTAANPTSFLNLGFAYCTGAPPPASCTNNNGNLQSQTIATPNVTQTYGYDAYNRLNSAAEKAGSSTVWSETFNYDIYGNRWVPSSSGISLSALTVTSDAYNTLTNRLTSGNFGYDTAGNETTISPFTVTYDVENRQTGFSSISNGTATYTYDGDGRRVTKTTGGVTTTYVYDATGDLASEYSTQPPPPPCLTCYVTTDHLGSTRVVTDETAAITARHDFLPFGEELTTSNRTAALGYGAYDNVMHKYTGKERDTETGLDFFNARYFSSAQGRFTSPDPIGIMAQKLTDPQQWNMYQYSKNNPLRFMDPSGMYVTTCTSGDKGCAANASAFEKARQSDLKSKDASVRAAAGAYGDPGKANGVTVTWGDPGKGTAGNTVVTGLTANSDGTFTANATVTIRAGQSGADLASTVGHEGQHVEDAQGFAATVTPLGFYDLSKNLTSFQTEMNAYRISNSILNSNGVQRSFGSCDGGPCTLGQGIVNPDPIIRQLLANPANGYGVTEANQGSRQNPNITTPNPAPPK